MGNTRDIAVMKPSPDELKYQKSLGRLKALLDRIGFVTRGSIRTGKFICGKAACRCHEDPTMRHGPYHRWTRKVKGKTSGRTLSAAELPIYQQAIEDDRELQRAVHSLYDVSETALRPKAKAQRKASSRISNKHRTTGGGD
jgi:hypothetical protein